ncbi:hypothetical protein GGI07_001071 [Coemansia sp. Benny D115]|nr:hypothetical protein GGI07_001071 [Coemansia sp. Benny D115]
MQACLAASWPDKQQQAHAGIRQQSLVAVFDNNNSDNAGNGLVQFCQVEGQLNTKEHMDTWSEFSTNFNHRYSRTSVLNQYSLSNIQQHQSSRYFATRKLLWSLGLLTMCLLLFGSIVTAVTMHSLPHFAIVCHDSASWIMWPVYGTIALLVGLVFPLLEYKVWLASRNTNMISRDIPWSMVGAQVAMAVYIIWITALDFVRGYLCELFVVWIYAHMVHILVCRECSVSATQQGAQLSQAGLSNVSFKGNSVRRSMYSTAYRDFQRIVESKMERESFMAFAARYYQSSIPAFLSDFQTLKIQTIQALDAASANRAAVNEISTHRSPVISHEYELDQATPMTKGILDSVILALTEDGIDQATVFPESVRPLLMHIVSTYLENNSPMSINIPSEVIEQVQLATENEDSVLLSALDRAKDEALFLLCTDVYVGYCRLQNEQSRVGQD